MDASSEIIHVIPVGSTVSLSGVPATVIAVCIADRNHITYQCVWMDGRNRNSQWVESCEVTIESPKTMAIGFLAESRGLDR